MVRIAEAAADASVVRPVVATSTQSEIPSPWTRWGGPAGRPTLESPPPSASSVQRPVLRPESVPRRQVLDNGSILLTRALPDVYGVGVAVVIRTGTRDETPEQGGISHLLEHMVFKGSARRSAFELARDMESLGGQLDAYTTKEHTAYTLKVLPEQLEASLSILVEMLEGSVFPADQLELEKQVVIEEILSAEDTPDDFAHERFCEHLWPQHPLRAPILGTEETVQGIDRATLLAHFEQVHRGGNVLIAAAGALGEAEEELVATTFGFASGPPAPNGALPAPPSPGVWCHPKKSIGQQYVEIGVPGLPMDHPDRYVIAILSNILGGGMSSRLFQRVREEEGLAYGIYNYVDSFRDTGMLATSFSASKEKAQRALDLVAEEYERLRKGDLPADELQSNKSQLVSSVVLGMESVLSQTLRLARAEISVGRFVPVAEIVARVDEVTRDDVIRLAEELLDPAKQTVVGYGPLAKMRWPGL